MSDGSAARATTDKPSYLGLLNAIAQGESRAHCYLTAWADATSDTAVRRVLQTVGLREGEHGMAFAKRINELGFELREKADPRYQAQLEIASSTRSDLEKMEMLGFDRLESDVLTVFDNVFRDHSIDVRTGELLGRYIAEEHDSARLLRSCYEALKDRPAGRGGRDQIGAKEAPAEPTRRRSRAG
jgi:hypothetical protein